MLMLMLMLMDDINITPDVASAFYVPGLSRSC